VVTLTGLGGTQTLTTGPNGYYIFTGLAPGTYKVTLTTPSSGDVAELSHDSVIIAQSQTVTITADASSAGNDFPEIDYPASVTGMVFMDINDSGNFDSGDRALGGAKVTLTGTNYFGNAVSLTTTSSSTITNNANFSFTNLLPSNANGYTITVTPPSGYLNGTDTAGNLGGTTTQNSGVISQVVIPGCNNAGTGYNFGEMGIFAGLTATIGFWKNNNGQGLLDSFGTTSTGLTLANWLATNLPNLFGKNAPAWNVNSTIGTNLTNQSDQNVASYFVTLFNAGGMKPYAQVLATAFAVFTTTNSLDTGTTSRNLATGYGFTLSNTGAGAATYTVPSADWPALQLTSSNATQSIAQLLLLANKYAKSGVLNGGNTTQINETNDVFGAINNLGDIGLGLTILADGTGSGSSLFTGSLGQVYGGTYLVSVDTPQDANAAAEEARIQDAIDQYNTQLAAYGVTLEEIPAGVTATPDIQIHFADTTAIGGVADGVLGVTMLGGQITLVNGWNWYTGSDASAVGAGQYDFQTVATHEIGHAIGLGHSADQTSVMYPTLATGEARRSLSASDLAELDQDAGNGPEPLRADVGAKGAESVMPVAAISSTPAMTSSTTAAAPVMPASVVTNQAVTALGSPFGLTIGHFGHDGSALALSWETNASPAGMIAQSTTGVTRTPMSGQLLAQKSAWTTVQPAATSPVAFAQPSRFSGIDRFHLDGLIVAEPRSGPVVDSVLDELGRDSVLWPSHEWDGSVTIPVLPPNAGNTGAVPGDPTAQLDDPVRSPGPFAERLALLGLAAGLCGGAGVVQARKRRSRSPSLREGKPVPPRPRRD
jgi:hypothetical protein